MAATNSSLSLGKPSGTSSRFRLSPSNQRDDVALLRGVPWRRMLKG
jgi:hypothetical protein